MGARSAAAVLVVPVHRPPWQLLVAALLLPLVLAASLPAPAAAEHVAQAPFQCDGGFCDDGRHRSIDCRRGHCTGDPRGFATLLAPSFDDGAWLQPGDRVLGLVVGEDARAYPLRILTWFETVQDNVGPEPVVVTYCPLCGSGIVYSRVLDGDELTLFNTGAIWRNDLVMYDRQTESWWTQIGGEALTGPLHGRHLTLVPSQHVTWQDWREAHPDTKVLRRPMTEAGEPMAPYHRDPRGPAGSGAGISSHTHVHGIELGGEALALPVPQLAEEHVAHLSLAGQDLVAAHAGGDVHVFLAAGRTFEPAGPGAMRSSPDASEWDVLTGEGPDGQTLERVPGRTTYWFAWRDFHPDTALYQGRTAEGLPDIDADPPPPTDPARGIPGAAPALVGVAALGAALLPPRRRG